MPDKKVKRLYKSKTNRVFSGVIGGLGEYLNIDPVVLRLIYVLVTAFMAFFPGLVAYIILALIVPEN